MRRPAAALVTAVLAAAIVAGPTAAPGLAAPSSSIECSSDTLSPVCPLLDQLAAQLAPVQPVLALADPVTAPLAAAVAGLAARADQPGGVPSAEATTQAKALLGQLSVLPAPVRDLLAGTPLDGLVATLEDLVAELAAPVTGDQSAADSGSPTPSATGGSTSQPGGAGSSRGPASGGSMSASGGGATTSATSSPAIPDVPVGDSLTFAPLALPDFGFSPTIGLDRAPVASDALIEDVQRAVNAAALDPFDTGDDTNVGLVAGATLLLLAAAWAAQVRQAREAARTIPD